MAAQRVTRRSRASAAADSAKSGQRPAEAPIRAASSAGSPSSVHQALRHDLRIGAELLAFQLALAVDDAIEILVGEGAAKRLPQAAAPVQDRPEDVEGHERD
jgi:hypothetical protein